MPRLGAVVFFFLLAVVACDRGPDTIRLGVVQTGGVPGDVSANLDHAEGLVRDAAARGARWIVFPELYALYPAARAKADAETIRRETVAAESQVRARMIALAHELDVHIALGKPEAEDGKLYNTLLFVEPDGVAATHRKHLLIPGLDGPSARGENVVFAPGTGPLTVEWGGIRVGALICADSGLEGFWKSTAKDELRLVVWSSSSASRGSPNAPTPAERARANAIPIAFANRSRAGEPQAPIAGGSQIIDATGTILAHAKDEPEAVLVADVPLRRP